MNDTTTTTTTTDSAPRWLLSIPEACKGLGVGRSTFYEMVARGDVEVVRIGRRALVPVAAIEAYVQGLRPSHGVPQRHEPEAKLRGMGPR